MEDSERNQFYRALLAKDAAINLLSRVMRDLIEVAEKLPQSATHDGIKLCDKLANARHALEETEI